jgi:hypothetical protein
VINEHFFMFFRLYVGMLMELCLLTIPFGIINTEPGSDCHVCPIGKRFGQPGIQCIMAYLLVVKGSQSQPLH